MVPVRLFCTGSAGVDGVFYSVTPSTVTFDDAALRCRACGLETASNGPAVLALTSANIGSIGKPREEAAGVRALYHISNDTLCTTEGGF